MISIIISSYQPDYFTQLTKNIGQTIGSSIEYEIIQIWNPNLMSITKAYNSGAEKAKYDNLLFLHEDVIFHTSDWGEKLIIHLNNINTGVIGVAGSDYVPSAPCSWTVVSGINRNFYHILQNNKDKTNKTLQSNIDKTYPVFGLDGVFLSIKKEKFNVLKFDENIPGFHGYDLDFTLRSAKKNQNYVIHDILIEHFSTGNANREWFFSNMEIRKKNGCDYQQKNIGRIEREAFVDFMKHFFKYHKANFKQIKKLFEFYPFFKMSIFDHYKVVKILSRYIFHKN